MLFALGLGRLSMHPVFDLRIGDGAFVAAVAIALGAALMYARHNMRE